MARRKLIWVRQPLAITSLTNVSAGINGAIETNDLLQVFRAEAGLLKGPVGLTVMRVRAHFSLDLVNDGPTSSIRSVGGVYYGIRVFDTQELIDLDANEVVARGPVSDPHADWMTWGRIPVKQTTGTVFLASQEVDVRAMRKLEELGQTLGIAMQSTSAVATGSVGGVYASTSVLVALP